MELEIKQNLRYEILTDHGFEDFSGVKKTFGKNEKVTIFIF